MLSTMIQGLNQVIFSVKKASPEILLVGGVIGVVGSTVLACKATLKAEEILDEHAENMETIHEAEEKCPEKYTEHDVQVDTTRTYIHTVTQFVKAYAPAVILGTLSIAAIISSHSIMKQRNMALAAALSSANAMFNEYRERVRHQLGEEVDEKIFNGGRDVVRQVEVTNDKGKKKIVDQQTVEYKDRPLDPYAKFFGEEEKKDGLNTNWKNTRFDNQLFLTQHEKWLNQRLKWEGFLTLIDVYRDLGWEVKCEDPRFDEYRNMGWTDHDFIDLGLASKRSEDFMKGETNEVWLTFNCHSLYRNRIATGGKYISAVA